MSGRGSLFGFINMRKGDAPAFPVRTEVYCGGRILTRIRARHTVFRFAFAGSFVYTLGTGSVFGERQGKPRKTGVGERSSRGRLRNGTVDHVRGGEWVDPLRRHSRFWARRQADPRAARPATPSGALTARLRSGLLRGQE